ncbi:MAG: ABC transporter ATP-binding protein [Aldersonia sp.]|nr:ABC transporter ATP-binding protein [Aldersonia sp.]
MTTTLLTRISLAAQAVGVVKQYGTGPTAVRALDGIDIDLPKGQFTAVMGPSGSGKSTLMQALAGLDTIDAGTVRVGDIDVSSLSEKQRTLLRRDQIGFVFQAYNLVPTLTARENILLPLTLAGSRPDAAWFDQLVSTLGIGDRLEHRPSELSGGEQQRVAVGRALVNRPQLVFADEPTGNLDSSSSRQLLTFLRHTVVNLGQTIVMVTHDPASASYADRVVFLADGRIVDEMTAPSVDRVLDRMRRFDTDTETH